MLSRVAENLYWIGRYVERAENVARLLDDGFQFELDAAGLVGEAGERGPVGSVLNILSCRDAFERRPAPPTIVTPCCAISHSTGSRTIPFWP